MFPEKCAKWHLSEENVRNGDEAQGSSGKGSIWVDVWGVI